MSLLFGLFISSLVDNGLDYSEINLSFKGTMVATAIDSDFNKGIFTFLHVDLDGSALSEIYDFVEEVKGGRIVLTVFVDYGESEEVGRLICIKEGDLDET